MGFEILTVAPSTYKTSTLSPSKRRNRQLLFLRSGTPNQDLSSGLGSVHQTFNPRKPPQSIQSLTGNPAQGPSAPAQVDDTGGGTAAGWLGLWMLKVQGCSFGLTLEKASGSLMFGPMALKACKLWGLTMGPAPNRAWSTKKSSKPLDTDSSGARATE